MTNTLTKLLQQEKNVREGADLWQKTPGPLQLTGLTGSVKAGFLCALQETVQAAQTLVSRVNNPLRPLVLGFESVRAGKQFNIVCDKVQLTGCLQAYDDELLMDMADKLKKLARRTAETFDCRSEMALLPEGGAC